MRAKSCGTLRWDGAESALDSRAGPATDGQLKFELAATEPTKRPAELVRRGLVDRVEAARTSASASHPDQGYLSSPDVLAQATSVSSHRCYLHSRPRSDHRRTTRPARPPIHHPLRLADLYYSRPRWTIHYPVFVNQAAGFLGGIGSGHNRRCSHRRPFNVPTAAQNSLPIANRCQDSWLMNRRSPSGLSMLFRK